ncbi:hypothetical protein UlMin_038159 [Ulmus minor]
MIFSFLGKACKGEARQFKESLDLFCSWLGLSFNSTKSNIFFNANTRSRTSSIISQIMGFEHIPLTSCYLGLPMFRSQKMRDFNFLVECLDSKLVGWKAQLLSKAGRLTLIKSMALALPIYAMHSIKVPKTICAQMDARIRRFWWGSNDTNPRPLCLKA